MFLYKIIIFVYESEILCAEFIAGGYNSTHFFENFLTVLICHALIISHNWSLFSYADNLIQHILKCEMTSVKFFLSIVQVIYKSNFANMHKGKLYRDCRLVASKGRPCGLVREWMYMISSRINLLHWLGRWSYIGTHKKIWSPIKIST